MLKTAALCLLLSLVTLLSSAQKIDQPAAYALYFKTWNFIKYYHPDLASGKLNADSIFLRYIDEIAKVQDKKTWNTFLQSSLLQFPLPAAIAEKDTAAAGSLLYKNVNFNWYTKSDLLDRKNKKRLAAIFKHRYQSANHYYLPALNFNSDIPNEKVYSFPKTENIPAPYRLLALAKMQGVVDYMYPHKYLMERNFDSLLQTQIIPALDCKDRKAYELILLTLSAALQDSHTYSFYEQLVHKREIFNTAFFPPFAYKVFEDGIIVTDIIIPENCQAADIKTGDYIVAINGKPVKERVGELASLLSVSNPPVLLHYLSGYAGNLVWGLDNKEVNLIVLRNNQKATKKLVFIGPGDTEGFKALNAYLSSRPGKQTRGEALTIFDHDFVYFKLFDTFRFIRDVDDDKIDRHMDSLFSLAKNKKGIIFDMRGYPDWGGFAYTFLVKEFGTTPHRYARYYEVNKQTVGTYQYKPGIETYHQADLQVKNAPYTGKVVIIVSPETLSQSEWNTMNIQKLFPNAITIGEQSAGADGDSKTINLPGNYALSFTGNAIFYNDGTEAQKTGVKINIPLKLTKDNFSPKGDYLLEKAIEVIKK